MLFGGHGEPEEELVGEQERDDEGAEERGDRVGDELAAPHRAGASGGRAGRAATRTPSARRSRTQLGDARARRG